MTRNSGGAVAGYHAVGTYLSTDSAIATNDLLLGSDWFSDALSPGQSLTNIAWCEVPTATAPGSYYLGGMADINGVVAETNELNNGRTGNVIIIRGPDFAMTQVSGSTNGTVGGYIVVTNTVANLSSAGASDMEVGFYLSTNAVIGTDDVLLGTRTIASLPAGSANTNLSSVYVAPGIAAGQYYIGAIADPFGYFGETNENNNARTGNTLRIRYPSGPDLALTILSGPTNGEAGAEVVITNVVVNVGTGPAPEVNVGFYLSADPALSADDLLIGFRYIGVMGSSEASTASFPIKLADNIPPGEYYLGGMADYDARLIESNEVNNLLVGNRINITSAFLPLAFMFSRGGGAITSVWSSAVSGRVYQLQRAQGIGNIHAWDDIGGLVTAESAVVRMTDPDMPATQAFYRILWESKP